MKASYRLLLFYDPLSTIYIVVDGTVYAIDLMACAVGV
jgi:hypothetical protein